MKTVAIFGSTGSIGKNVLEIIKKSPPNSFVISALVANTNYQLLATQSLEYKAKLAVIYDKQYYQDLKALLAHTNIQVLTGDEGIEAACKLKSDMVVGAMVGIAGLSPIYQAISAGSDILLANKESLVCAGTLMKNHAAHNKVRIIPVDSEHNAIFQVLEKHNHSAVDKIILTASGGPFRNFTTKAQLNQATLKDALKHPNWNMGAKITIDSATMCNKGLEIIEAHYLFDIPEKDIEVLVHPQSIIHSMVRYKDGSILAQLSPPDMQIPILHSLHYPTRYHSEIITPQLDFLSLKDGLTFAEPKHDLFPSLNYARSALEKGSAAQILFNAANEILVANFLEEKIKFTDIFEVIGELLEQAKLLQNEVKTIADVLALNEQYQQITREAIAKL